LDASSPIKRLAAGDRELARPSSGLSLAQRRLLTQLGTPASLAELAARGNLEPRKLERDLARLTEIGLVDAGGAALPPPPEMQSRSPANESFGAPRRGVGIAVTAAVIGLAATAWLGWPTLSGAPPAAMRWPSSPVDIASAPMQPKTPVSAATVAVTAAVATPPPVLASATPPIGAASPDTASVAGRIDVARTRGSKIVSSRSTPGVSNTRATANGEGHEPSVGMASRDSPSDSPQREVFPRPTAPAAARAQTSAATTAAAGSVADDNAPVPLPMAAPAAAERSPDRSPTQIAMAAPSAAASTPAAPSTSAAPSTPAPPKLLPLVREDPQFPREALRRDIDRGRVKARLSIDAAGKVTGVAILQASPRGVFEGAVRTALVHWQFPPGAAGRSTEVDVAFNRD
jgi:TonB family protein